MAQDMVRDGDRRSLGTAALRGLGFLILTALMTVIIVVQQRAAGAYTAEFSATRVTEAGHVVTGLMMADYLASGLPAPLAFITDYALHFPRVVLGLQPPLYYLVEGVWVSVLGPSTPAVLLLPAFLLALLVVTAGWASARLLGVLPGVAVGAVLLALPLVRETAIVVGLDLPLALLGLWAALAYGRYLASDGRHGALAFAFLASAAILTKGSGVLLLLLLPPLALVLAGRFRLLCRWSFWLPFLIIAVLAGPWTIGTFPMVSADFPQAFGRAFAEQAAQRYGADLLAGFGGLLLVLSGLGLVFAVIGGWRRRAGEEVMVAVAALALATAVVLCAVPQAFTPTALVPLFAPLIMLAAYGAMRLIGLLTTGWGTIAGLMVALLLLLVAMPGTLEPLRKPANGMDEVAEAMFARAGGPASILVVADAKGEGALVAAVAQSDKRGRSFVLPASTVLALRGLGPAEGTPLYPDPKDMMAGLDRLAPGFIALAAGSAPTAGSIRAVMDETLAAFPDRFELLGRFPRREGTPEPRRGEIRLYAVKPAPAAGFGSALDLAPGAAPALPSSPAPAPDADHP